MTTPTLRGLADRAAAPRELGPPRVAGYAFRPMTVADAAAVYDVVAAYEAADDVNARSSADDVTEYFDDPWWDASTDSLLAVTDDDGTEVVCGRALVSWRPGAARRVTVELLGGVHPDHRRRGLGTALLDWQLQRGRQVLAAAPEQDLPGALVTTVGDRQPGLVALAEGLGLTARRWFHDMVRDLADPVPEPPGLADVRLLVLADNLHLAEGARQARMASFAEHYGSEPIDAATWQRHVVAHQDRRMDLSLVAVDPADQVVGLLITGVYPQDWPDPDRPEGWVDLLGVVGEYRGRGIASAMLLDAMRRYRERGMATAGLSVDNENVTGALRLYEGLGFQPRRIEMSYEIHV